MSEKTIKHDDQKQALCSVIIPVHNSEYYVAEAIRSALNQTYKNLEIIIIDDASEDSSREIIKGFILNNDFVRLVELPENNGTAFARNIGLQTAKGKFIAFLDSDDIWLPTKIENQILVMETSGCDLTFTAYEMIDENGNFIKRRNIKQKISFSDLLKENSIIFSSVVCRAAAVRTVKFDETVFHEDYLYLLNLLKNNKKFYGLDEILMRYRVHGTGKSFNKVNAAIQRWKIYRDYLHLGFFTSLYYFTIYACNGVLKYI